MTPDELASAKIRPVFGTWNVLGFATFPDGKSGGPGEFIATGFTSEAQAVIAAEELFPDTYTEVRYLETFEEVLAIVRAGITGDVLSEEWLNVMSVIELAAKGEAEAQALLRRVNQAVERRLEEYGNSIRKYYYPEEEQRS